MPKSKKKTQKYYTIDDPTLLPIVNDLPQTMTTINNYNIRLKELRTSLVPTMNHCKDVSPGDSNSDLYVNNGISFLQLRTQLLLQYNMNLLQYMMLRSDGRKIKNHPCIQRLIHLRLLFEKIKPIMTQLQYQIDQILQQQQQTKQLQQSQQNDQIETSSHPHPHQHSTTQFSAEQLTAQIPLSKAQLNEQKKAEYRERQEQLKQVQLQQEEELSKLNKTVKFSDFSTQYNTANVGDDAASQWHAQEHRIAREKEKKEKIRDKALYSTLVQQLRNELTERPIEESASGLSMHRHRTREQKERREFEEDNFIRLHESKQERKKQRRMDRLQGMDDIEEIADYTALYQFAAEQENKKKRDEALRAYEEAEAGQKLMAKIERNVRKGNEKRGRHFD
jgi:hypothetical protein